MNITFSIISRGSMLVKYNDREVKISGELTFDPPVFYADIISLDKWEPPFENVSLNEEEKNDIITNLVTQGNEEGQTKIMFD